ncbi:WW domain-containing adapter with coiled-coil isoform X2 [Pelobates cultripes]|uniref:WW domain-containing adapter protein with coiled-coil n=2 Tax=Pelobates cultripes TaxID=61616 RepID=A0AAD1RVQ2_PELCU|nr:WW domain-containing adapter with coiled-coil isoform X2 [Pelobates cultripes]
MVMYARKQPRLSDGCHDRRDSQPYQTLKYSSKSHPSSSDHRHDKMRDCTDPSPPSKMRRSDSPENKYGDSVGHGKAKSLHVHRVRERDGGTSFSPQENSHNHSALHSSNSHSNPSKTSDAAYDPADDWSEHISSSGKKYYYNCRTEVSQWEKPKEWLEREQRQKESSKVAVNSFPKDRDYRREAMQATATVDEKHSSDASSMLPQNILSQTSRHNDRDYRLPRTETHSSAAPVQHSVKPVVHPSAAQSTVSSSPYAVQPDHPPPKKSFDANGAATLSKLPMPTSSISTSKSDRKEAAPADKSCTTPSTSTVPALNQSTALASSSTSTVPVSPVPQSPIPPLLQDPTLLRQLLPALQATLQLNNSNVDISKINEVLTAAVTQASLQSILHKILTAGPSAFNVTSLISQVAQLSTQATQSNQSPMSLTSDASSPRSYVSPRISTPQTNTVPHKPLINTPPVTSQPKASTAVGSKQGPSTQSVQQQTATADNPQGHEPTSPRNLQRQSSQRSPSPAPNHTSSTCASSTSSVSQNASARNQCALTPSLAAYFNENLIKHVQGWPAEHAEKQASRLREESHMGSIHMAENSTELKNLRSLVRVCEIQATLREQRILFLRQQIKELEKLKNQNSFMV